MAFKPQTRPISGGRGRGRIAIKEDQIAISKQLNKKEGDRTIYYIGMLCCKQAEFKPGKGFLVNVDFDEDSELVRISAAEDRDPYGRTLQAETKSWKRKNSGRKAFVYVKIVPGVVCVDELLIIKDKDIKAIRKGLIVFSVKNIKYEISR